MNIFNSKPEETLFVNNTVIEHGMVVDAVSVSGSCGLVVRGIVKASIDLDADVTIDSSGSVEGDIICGNCTVRGRVDGSIAVTGHLYITDEGILNGDITCSSLQISNGGTFCGSCNRARKTGQANVFDIFGQSNEKTAEEEVQPLEAADGN